MSTEETAGWADYIWAVLLWGIAIVLALVSTGLNGLAGLTFWSGTGDHWPFVFASLFVLADSAKYLFSAILPRYARAGQVGKVTFLTLLVVGLMCMSVMAVYSLGQRNASKTTGASIVAKTTLADLKQERRDIRAELLALGTIGNPNVIKAEIDELDRSRLFHSSHGCTDATRARSRYFCASRDRLMGELAGATRAAQLRADIKRISAKIRGSITVETVASPHAGFKNMAERFGVSEAVFADNLILAIAITVELVGTAAWMFGSTFIVTTRSSPDTGTSVANVDPHKVELPTQLKTTTKTPTGQRSVSRNSSSPRGTTKQSKATLNSGKPNSLQSENVVQLRHGPKPKSKGGSSSVTTAHLTELQGARRASLSPKTEGNLALSTAASLKLSSAMDREAHVRAFVSASSSNHEEGDLLASELLATYQGWCERLGVDRLADTTFFKTLVSVAIFRKRKSKGIMVYTNVKLKEA